MPEEAPARNIVVKIANNVTSILEAPVVWFRGIQVIFLVSSMIFHLIAMDLDMKLKICSLISTQYWFSLINRGKNAFRTVLN